MSATNKALALALQKFNQTAQVINLLNNSDETKIEKSLAVHDKGSVRFVKVQDIVSIEADINYSIITVVGNEKIVTTRILKELDEVLEDSKIFMRINKSCLVNINFIKTYSKKEPHILTLVDGREFEISRRKKQEVNERLDLI